MLSYAFSRSCMVKAELKMTESELALHNVYCTFDRSDHRVRCQCVDDDLRLPRFCIMWRHSCCVEQSDNITTQRFHYNHTALLEQMPQSGGNRRFSCNSSIELRHADCQGAEALHCFVVVIMVVSCWL